MPEVRPIDANALIAKLKIDTNTATYSDYCNGYCDARQVDLDAIDAAPTIEPEVRHGRWIPCSERLPNEAGKYIVCGRWHGEKPKTWICQFIIFGDIGGFSNPAENPPISFWMPLPEPPEKE